MCRHRGAALVDVTSDALRRTRDARAIDFFPHRPMYSTASRASRRRPNARRGDDDDVDIARLARASSPSGMMMGKTLVETHRATRRARRASAEKEGAVTRMKLSSRRDGRARRVTARAGVKDVDIGVSA